MGLNETPSGERVRIGFFGMRNAGKSSLVNAVCGQQVALVSDVAGTTTDPVRKAMELLPLGPVDIVDTPGIDDVGELGARRVERTRETLRSCDVAVLVTDATREPLAAERELLSLFEELGLPFIVVRNKADLLPGEEAAAGSDGVIGRAASGAAAAPTPQVVAAPDAAPAPVSPARAEVLASARTGAGITELKEALAHVRGSATRERRVVADLLSPGDKVVLVVPIDSSAPKGRIILPQQLVLRDVLDAHASALVCQPEELADLMAAVGDIRLVITDSQAFQKVARIVAETTPLTSFSLLMARYKGDLHTLVEGTSALGALTDESRVLISEGCTHHRQCEDIGTVKMPAWIRSHCGANPTFEFTQGRGFPDDVSGYDVVVHCGGCMLNEKEMRWRQSVAAKSGTPMVNYGAAIACVHGILERSLRPLM
ncbi:[FeFe] hydrogenase H-cluster maturation GTPase HydF [uncultured Ellagibacter sp.]|uniref:[FeFe] hydrogenase H-cluster maturation GTPase HydF n=1 Tax=uncultured Ellagibacter sp. TaxID=2137580 RepID=UPI0025FC4BA8|nr:[FeFe] hydrogenase H-cluster maturation GTPase HydF [uncultured Ellagibacter sp.]